MKSIEKKKPVSQGFFYKLSEYNQIRLKSYCLIIYHTILLFTTIMQS